MAHPLLALSCSQAPQGISLSFATTHLENSNSSSSIPMGSTALSFHASHSYGRLHLRHQQQIQQQQGIRVAAVKVSSFLDHDSNDQGLFHSSAMLAVMKKEYGSVGAVTLEKPKMDLSPTSKTRSAPQLEHFGGGSNNNRIVKQGGGGDDGDDGDDDDYFDGEDDDEEPDEGLFTLRSVIDEVFEGRILEAVMREWYRTMSDLPAGFRQAYQMGLLSSAQLVRFLSINSRPTFARALYRLVPSSLPRLLADPSWYPYKVALEQVATIGYGVWWEIKHRGDRIRDEWDLAACNVLTLAACNMVAVWSLAPTRSYSSRFRYAFQIPLQKLPSNVFAKSYKMHEYDMQQRVLGFLYKTGILAGLGAVFGAAGAGLSKGCLALRKKRGKDTTSSVPVPSLATSSAGYGAFLGISGNLRYQLVCGAERFLQDRFNHIGFVLLCSAALRCLSIPAADATRVAWLGLDTAAIRDRDKAYRRSRMPSLDDLKQGFSLSGMVDGKSPFTKRKVKRRVMAVH